MDQDEVMTTSEAADVLCCGASTLRAAHKLGLVQEVRLHKTGVNEDQLLWPEPYVKELNRIQHVCRISVTPAMGVYAALQREEL